MKKNNPINSLLKKNISKGQLIGYALANLVGLAILLTAFQLFCDTKATDSEDSEAFFKRDYLILSKRVNDLDVIKQVTNVDYNSPIDNPTAFSTAEIDELAAQSWVENVGLFTPSRFRVSGAVDFAGRGISTHLFFESIPDRFFDVLPENWHFDPNDPTAPIPIIISKDYLSLYNFGFAATRGLPQISEQIITTVPLRITLSGNGLREYRQANIVGFSSRLNTIAVPETFMMWANERYGDSTDVAEVSRLIVEVNDPGNPDIEQYLNSHNIEAAGEKLNQNKVAYFLSIVSAVVFVIGLIISVLAFFILMLSITLLLQKNRDKIHDLLMLGYTPESVAAYYLRLVAWLNGVILAVAIVAMLIASRLWAGSFDTLGLTTAAPWLTILLGVVLMVGVTLVNAVTIKRNVNNNFYS